MVTDLGPSTIESNAAALSTRYPFQRKGFYAQGYHFEFYYADSTIYWRSSADGTTWGSANDITPTGMTPNDGNEIAVCLDNHESPAHHVLIAYADQYRNSALYYRRGTIATNGTITWEAVWQTAVPLVGGVSYRNPTICVDDTNGYPFIGYTHTIRADPSTGSYPRVTHTEQTDGTWSTLYGFPETLNATNDESWVCSIVPYSGDDIMAVYARDSTDIKYDIYDIAGDSWAGEVASGVTMGTDATKMSVTSQKAGAVSAQDPRRVHVAFCYTDENLNHISIDDSAVTGPTLIYSSTLTMGPSISTRTSGGDVNNYRTLYVFWTPITDLPTADYVCYKKSIDAGANWTKEDGSAGVELWVDETGAGLSGTDIASSYFEEFHHATLPTGYIGLSYTNEGTSPDYVRWAGLGFADPDDDLLCNALIRQPASAELLGKADVGQNSQNLLGNALIRHPASAELLGKADVGQNSLNLLGKVDVGQNSLNLLGNAVISQPASTELLGKLDVGQDSAELLGKFEAQATAELLGKAVIKHPGTPVELLGNAEIRHPTSAELLGNAEVRNTGSAELLSKFELQTTVELLGKFDVGQNIAELLGKLHVGHDSQELLGNAEIQQSSSTELLGNAEIRQPASAELLGNAEIRQPASAELLGNVTITHSVDLLGNAVIRQSGSAELLGNILIRHSDSEELMGKFRTTTDEWAIQGASVEAYIALTIVI